MFDEIVLNLFLGDTLAAVGALQDWAAGLGGVAGGRQLWTEDHAFIFRLLVDTHLRLLAERLAAGTHALQDRVWYANGLWHSYYVVSAFDFQAADRFLAMAGSEDVIRAVRTANTSYPFSDLAGLFHPVGQASLEVRLFQCVDGLPTEEGGHAVYRRLLPMVIPYRRADGLGSMLLGNSDFWFGLVARFWCGEHRLLLAYDGYGALRLIRGWSGVGGDDLVFLRDFSAEALYTFVRDFYCFPGMLGV